MNKSLRALARVSDYRHRNCPSCRRENRFYRSRHRTRARVTAC